MKILAIDLGKFKSVACDYDTAACSHAFTTIATNPSAMHDLIVEHEPDRMVIEIGSAAGWIQDLCEALDVEIQVAKRSGPTTATTASRLILNWEANTSCNP